MNFKILSFGVAMLLWIPGGLASRQTPGSSNVNSAKWKTYRNPKYGFEVKIPEDWSVQSGSRLFDSPTVTLIHLRKPVRPNEPDAYLALGIQENQNPKNLSIEELFAERLHALKAKPDVVGHVTIGGQPAVFMENTNSFGKQRDTFTLLHQRALLSFGYRRQAEFDATYEAIVASFHLVN